MFSAALSGHFPKVIGRVAAIACAAAMPLAAGTISASAALSLDLPGDAQRTKVSYSCRASENASPTEMVVEYINMPGNTLALVAARRQSQLCSSMSSRPPARNMSRGG